MIYYLGYYYPEEALKDRGLPGRYLAGKNRMRRVIRALCHEDIPVLLVSPCIAARCSMRSRLWHPRQDGVEESIRYLLAPALGIPYLGSILESFLFPIWFLSCVKRHSCAGIVMYNYSVSFAVLAVACKVLSIPLVCQLEDVAVARASDWVPGSETRPFQQVVMSVCMKIVLTCSNGVVAPSDRFKRYVPPRLPVLTINGCMPDDERATWHPVRLEEPLNVLFVGKYEREHGLHLLMHAIETISCNPVLRRRFVFHCTGTDEYPVELQSYAASAACDGLVRLYGVLSQEEYSTLLSKSAVGLVLQRSMGRHRDLKSPSKAFEFMAAGKIVVSTDIGDLQKYAPTFVVLLKEESPIQLVECLTTIADNPARFERMSKESLAFADHHFSSWAVGKVLRNFLWFKCRFAPGFAQANVV